MEDVVVMDHDGEEEGFYVGDTGAKDAKCGGWKY